MSQLYKLAYLVFFITLAGCSATGQVTTEYQPQAGDKFNYSFTNTDRVTPKAIPVFKERMENQLLEKGILASITDTDAKEVIVQFNNYRMRDGAVRALVGIFAGADNINTTIFIKEKDKTVGEYTVESSNASAWGTSRGLIESHIDKIINYLKKPAE